MSTVRYCETELNQIRRCNVQGASYSGNSSWSCRDEPKEKNCNNLADPDYLPCPCCGRNVSTTKEAVR